MTGGDEGQCSLAEAVAALPTGDAADILSTLKVADLSELLYEWQFWARPKQLPPAGEWATWLILAGRGFGKTRTGAEWVRGLAERAGADFRIALVGETAADVRQVMVEGESGLLPGARPDFRPRFEPSKRRLTWPQGAQAFLYSADDPEQLRGPQHHAAWCDELAKWRRAEETWSNLQLGLRLGERPQTVVTTTPRPLKLIKDLLADPMTVVSRGSTYDNRGNLPSAFFRQVVEKYAGTRLGRQEIEAEILEDTPGALWTRALLQACRAAVAPAWRRVVVGVDPPVTGGDKADACGIVVAAEGEDGRYYVLADRTTVGASVHGWAQAAVAAYHDHEADRLVAEVNNGGDLVAAVIRQVDPMISYRAVRASRGKWARAEPIAALYEQGRVSHLAAMPALEDQMTSYAPGGDMAYGSPDRLDALVWALSELALGVSANPRLRTIG